MSQSDLLLTEGARILATEPPGSVAALQQVLHLLVTELPLAAAEAWLPRAEGNYDRLSSPGPARLVRQLHLPANVPTPSSLQSSALVGQCWLVPLPQSGALLRCVLSPPSNPGKTDSAALAVIAPLLDLGICHYQRDRALSGNHNCQRFLLKLSRTLAKAGDSTTLLASVGQLLLRHTKATCVVLRSLHASAVLGPPLIFFPKSPGLELQECLDAETSLALAALSRNEVRLQTITGAASSHSAIRLICLPLRCGEQTYGTLCLGTRLRDQELATTSRQLRTLLQEVSILLGPALARVATLEQRDRYSTETDHKLQELSSLLHISRGLYGSFRFHELPHFLLSAVTVAPGGGFSRAALFMVNNRTETLQGMLGITSASAAAVLPAEFGLRAWETPRLHHEALQSQRQTEFSRHIMRLRLELTDSAHPLARCISRQRIIIVTDPERSATASSTFAAELGLGSFACVPLLVDGRPLAILVVGNPPDAPPITTQHLKFLELFSRLAAAAFSQALLLRRLESTNQNLKETQERLLQGEKLAMLGEMAASIAHELKTPLVTIGGFARRLENPKNQHLTAEYAGIIAREARRLEELLEGILTFARKPLLCFADCDLPQLISEVLKGEEDLLAQVGISVRIKNAPDLPPLRADIQKMRQVLINLVSNARQAMPTGGVLKVRLGTSELRGQPAIALDIEDSGGGIPDEHRPWIFTPFFSTKEGGTGLGLPIAARIIEQHGGQLEVFNRARGAVFIIRLPCS